MHFKKGLRRQCLTPRGHNLGGKCRQLGVLAGQEEYAPIPRDPPMVIIYPPHFLKSDLLPWIHQNLEVLSELCKWTSNLLFLSLSDHFWHLNPVLDCKILRESKDKCVYKSQQSTYLYRYDFMGLRRHKIDQFPNLIILERWNHQVPMQHTLSLLWAQNSFLKG